MTFRESRFRYSAHMKRGLAWCVQDIIAALPDDNIFENVFDAYAGDTADLRGQFIKWLNEIDS